MDEFVEQRDTLMQQMVARKRGEVFQDYLASTRARMEKAGDIRIYEDAVAKLDSPMLDFGQ
jgi:hypothetical protein